MKNINIHSFERFFEVDEAGFLLSDIYSRVYKDIGFLAINRSNRLSILLSKNGTSQSRNTGFKLYTSNEYTKYIEEFKTFIDSFDENAQKLDLSVAQERLKLFDLIVTFLSFYKNTEFFYTDRIFEVESRDFEKQKASIEVVKTQGRQLLNKIFLENDGYLNTLFGILEVAFNITTSDAFNMSVEEIIEFPKNKIYLQRLIEKRKGDYLLLVHGMDRILSFDLPADTEFNQSEEDNIIHGRIACSGLYTGVARVIEPNYKNFSSINILIDSMKKGEILVSESTSPEITRACHLAGAIVTNQGGLGSHAAIISRELQIPCIVGTRDATKRIKTGDTICVDANLGVVRKVST